MRSWICFPPFGFRWLVAALLPGVVIASGMAIVAGLATMPGCDRVSGTDGAPPTKVADEVPGDDVVRQKVDDAVETTFRHRHLDVKQRAAWQIIHAAVAFGRDLLIYDENDHLVQAVDYALDGGYMRGWTLVPGTDLGGGRLGVRSVIESGTLTGQGHKDQWLGYLSAAGLSPERSVLVRGRKHAVADWIEQIKLDAPDGTEHGWTLMALSAYVKPDAKWQAGDGSEWSLERIMALEAGRPLKDAACGGTHSLGGLSMALNRHVAAGGKLRDERGEYLNDGWAAADRKIQECIAAVRSYQNDDGSFSINYFNGPGQTGDLADRMRTTGHTLEFLALSMTDEQLAEPWVTRGVVHLCDVLDATKELNLECGALYHGMNGLVVYRARRFGKLDISKWTREDLAEAGKAETGKSAAGKSEAGKSEAGKAADGRAKSGN